VDGEKTAATEVAASDNCRNSSFDGVPNTTALLHPKDRDDV